MKSNSVTLGNPNPVTLTLRSDGLKSGLVSYCSEHIIGLNISQSSMDKLGQIIRQGASNEKESHFRLLRSAAVSQCTSSHKKLVILGLDGYPE